MNVKLHYVILVDYGVDKYNIGTGFGHFGIAAEDVSSFFLNIAVVFLS